MGNEVKRYDWRTDVGCMVEEKDGAWVSGEDYDALRAEADEWQRRCQYNADTAHDVARERDRLHAEAEALQRKVTELTNQRDAILLQARCWAGEAKAQQAITKAVCEALGGVPDWGPIAAGVEALRAENGRLKREAGEAMAALVNQRDAARTELEAARGLLRQCDEIITEDGGVYIELRAYLAGEMPAADVVSMLTATPAPEGRQQEQGERQEPFVWMRPDGDESFELTSEGDYLSFPLYLAPQPGPDVRGLVEAVKGVKITPSDMRHWGRGSVWWNNAVEACVDAINAASRQAHPQ